MISWRFWFSRGTPHPPHPKIMKNHELTQKNEIAPPHPLTLNQKNYFKITPWFQTLFRGESAPSNSRKNPFWNQTRTFLRIHYVTIYHAKIQHLQILCRPSPVIPHFWNVCNFVLLIYIGLYLYYQFIYISSTRKGEAYLRCIRAEIYMSLSVWFETFM